MKKIIGIILIVVGLLAIQPAEAALGSGSTTSGYSIICSETCNHSSKCICAETGNTKLYGHKPIFTSVTAVDFEMAFNNKQLGDYTLTSIFIPDTNTPNSDAGVGYLNIPVEFDSSLVANVYFLCDICTTNLFYSYTQWLTACYQYYNPANYLENFVLVYPNPTNAEAYIEFNSTLANLINNGKITIKLFNSNDVLIQTFVTRDFTNLIQISSDYISISGNYYLNCELNVEFNDGTQKSKTFTVPFAKVAG